MRFLLGILAVVGAFMAPAIVVAGTTPLHLILAPSMAIVEPGHHEPLEFILVNAGAERVHVAVSASDGWVLPAEQAFDIAAGQRHVTRATIVIPSGHDAGDHETQLAFTIPPSNEGTLRVSWAVAARVIIASGGTLVHGLHAFGLSAPWVADSFDEPVVNLTLSNKGNVHEVATVTPFGQVLLLRGQTRVLSLRWSSHPKLGVGTITAGGQSVSTLFIPWRIAAGLLALLCGGLLFLRLREKKNEDA